MANAVIMGIDIDGRSLARVVEAFDRMPEAAARAMARTNRLMEPWLARQAARAASKATGTAQHGWRDYWTSKPRFHVEPVMANNLPVAVSIWLGTNPVPVHRLGNVKWTAPRRGRRGRRSAGARVGRKVYPGSWSWGAGSKTGTAVMRRTSPERKPIERVEEEAHDAVMTALAAVADQGGRMYERKLAQQLRYALTVEATA